MAIKDEQLKKEARFYLRISFILFNIVTVVLLIIAWPWSAFFVFCCGVSYQLDVYKLQIFDDRQKKD